MVCVSHDYVIDRGGCGNLTCIERIKYAMIEVVRHNMRGRRMQKGRVSGREMGGEERGGRDIHQTQIHA